MLATKRPYLIIPKFIEQPTWGGTYILELKNWKGHSFLANRKIGQSYELFGDSKLLLTINDSRDSSFIPELGFADKPDILTEFFPLKENNDYVTLSHLSPVEQQKFFGQKILEVFGKMPLLNKMNQAYGNSFQLHLKQSEKHPRWKPKAESWYYFENGLVTLGLKKEANVDEYKKTCHAINNKMKELSSRVIKKTLSLDEAKKTAKEFIAQANPWQFVNVYEVAKDSLIDLSAGGVHHSWEEDKKRFPNGNIVYEVQQDVMDPTCTIRSFDQGKFKEDGSIREIHIDDYFTFLDADPPHNDYENLKGKRNGNRLLSTKNYSMDILEMQNFTQNNTDGVFCHLFARSGDVTVEGLEGKVYLGQGHSCFVPADAGQFSITPQNGKAVLLKTFIET